MQTGIDRTQPLNNRLIQALILVGMTLGLGACANDSKGQSLTAESLTKQTAAAATQPNQTAAPSDALFELRTYTTHPDKLDALHSRFRDHTQGLFEKHGIINVAYWTPVEKPNTLVYLIDHKSKAAAEASWKAFIADPEWRAVYAASQANGPLVANIESVFMTATDYSPRI